MSHSTLKEIAKSLSISISTVSKALKDYPDVSQKTKQRVIEMAKKVNYSPNSFAQSLRNKKSKIIGLVVPEITHDFFSHIIKGVVDSAKLNGYLLILLQSEESYESEKKQIELLLEKDVDGILVSLSDNTIYFDHIQKAIDMGVPVVLYDKTSKSIDCSKVLIDDIASARTATEYLIHTGCKKIAHIRGPLKPQTTIDRVKGYRSALQQNKIIYNKDLVYESKHLSFEDGYQIMDAILKDHPDVDGIFSFTDLVAVGALTRLNELGIKVPEQISLIGFSNSFFTKVTNPSLTTVHQPGYKIGETAFDLLLKELTKKEKSPINETVIMPTKLIIRNSTKPLK